MQQFLDRLRCPVAACRRPFEPRASAVACARGHSFDIARSGYLNLLQPQDRRSRLAGDSREVVAARASLGAAGVSDPLVSAVAAAISEHTQGPRISLLDVGCGEGHLLRGLARRLDIEAHGVDLSVVAIEAAARGLRSASWVVANADRALPYSDSVFDVVTAIDARLNPLEMRRVLAPGGLLLAAVPAPDDLAELRALVLGRVIERDRTPTVRSRLAPSFVESGRQRVAHRVRLSAELARAAAVASYRAGRRSRAATLDALGPLELTFSWDLLRFLPASEPASVAGRKPS